VPTILSLVPLPKSYLSSLSIGTLKAILFDNHVRVDFKHVLEKADLIERLHALIEEERRRLERARMAEEREAAEADAEAARARGENVAVDPELAASPPRASPPAPAAAPTGPAPDMDRGLCVVCQDEEATLAVVDCGHLAMCQRE
jgi:DNA replication initiation complex subunit (GINS family)